LEIITLLYSSFKHTDVVRFYIAELFLTWLAFKTDPLHVPNKTLDSVLTSHSK